MTDLERAQTQVRELEALYTSLVESLPQCIIRKDREGRVTFANQHACRALARPPEEILGKTDCDLFVRKLAEKYRADDARVMRDRRPFEDTEEHVAPDGSLHYMHVLKAPLLNANGEPEGVQIAFWDITAQHRTKAQLQETQKRLLDATRQAGMAEVATGVLHNVGNVLNSVNVSATVLTDGLRRLKIDSLMRLCALLRENEALLGPFFTQDPKGTLVIEYLESLTASLREERDRLAQEAVVVQKNIDHIKEIVAMQQAYATMVGVVEPLNPAELMEDAVRMNSAALVRHDVSLVRKFAPVPRVLVERGKALQILVNLIRNAKYACDESGHCEKVITVRIESGDNDRVRLVVQDNGVGIPPENLTRIFSHGFTTRPGGHGFGLHSSVLAAQEMNGQLRAHSDGPGRGATFVLAVPVAHADSDAACTDARLPADATSQEPSKA